MFGATLLPARLAAGRGRRLRCSGELVTLEYDVLPVRP